MFPTFLRRTKKRPVRQKCNIVSLHLTKKHFQRVFPRQIQKRKEDNHNEIDFGVWRHQQKEREVTVLIRVVSNDFGDKKTNQGTPICRLFRHKRHFDRYSQRSTNHAIDCLTDGIDGCSVIFCQLFLCKIHSEKLCSLSNLLNICFSNRGRMTRNA